METATNETEPVFTSPIIYRVSELERELELSNSRLELLKRRLEAVEFNTGPQASEISAQLNKALGLPSAEVEAQMREFLAEIKKANAEKKKAADNISYFNPFLLLLLLVNTAMLLWLIADVRR